MSVFFIWVQARRALRSCFRAPLSQERNREGQETSQQDAQAVHRRSFSARRCWPPPTSERGDQIRSGPAGRGSQLPAVVAPPPAHVPRTSSVPHGEACSSQHCVCIGITATRSWRRFCNEWDAWRDLTPDRMRRRSGLLPRKNWRRKSKQNKSDGPGHSGQSNFDRNRDANRVLDDGSSNVVA